MDTENSSKFSNPSLNRKRMYAKVSSQYYMIVCSKQKKETCSNLFLFEDKIGCGSTVVYLGYTKLCSHYFMRISFQKACMQSYKLKLNMAIFKIVMGRIGLIYA